MSKSIPFPGKRWAKSTADLLAIKMYHEIRDMDRAELEALILTCEQFTATNCHWPSFYCRGAIISLAKSRLFEITPSSQHKRNKILKQHDRE